MSFFKGKLMAGARFLLLSCVTVAGLFSIIATGGGDNATSLSADTGTLSIELTDASTNEYQAIYVTIKEVQVHYADGDWVTAGHPGDDEVGKTYNLLELVNGVIEQLVLTELESGDYTQMRLILGDQHDGGTNILEEIHPSANYIIDSENNEEELKVPSGFQSGIKLVHPFSISAGGETELVLDFVAQRSVHKAGNKYILKPTIKVIDTTVSLATVSGTVTAENNVDETVVALEGVTVSAQYYNEGELVIQSSTLTDQGGNYKMILPEGISYYLVAYMDGYVPSSIADVILGTGDNLTDQNFTLAEAVTGTGTVSGSISIAGSLDEDDSAVLSFRQYFSGVNLEVKSVTVGYNAGNWPYSNVILPVGTYSGLASTDIANPESQERDNQPILSGGQATFSVTGGIDTLLDPILFP